MKNFLQVLASVLTLGCLGFLAGCDSRPARSTMTIPIPLPATSSARSSALPQAPLPQASLPQASAASSVVPLSAVREAKPGAPLTVRGTLVDKCPMSGCWFHLRDGRTVLRVEAKTAGFTVADVPLQSDVTVSGVVKRGGGEVVLEARSLRYGSTSLP